jgi:molecular chaperone IbpA
MPNGRVCNLNSCLIGENIMTRTLSLRTSDLHPTFHKFGIGFDNMLDEILRTSANQTSNYPPYNIIKQTDDQYYIEIAAAGFSQGEISVELNNRVLTVVGNKAESESAEPEYLHRGISGRSFERSFTLAEHVEVVDATNRDGVLSIFLERRVPEEKRPKTIDITYIK